MLHRKTGDTVETRDLSSHLAILRERHSDKAHENRPGQDGKLKHYDCIFHRLSRESESESPIL